MNLLQQYPKIQYFVLGFLLLALVGVTIGVSSHRAVSGSSDFDVYYHAGKALLEKTSIYTVERHTVSASKSPFVYPLFFACLMAPLTIFSIAWSASIWNMLNLFLFFINIKLILKITKFSVDRITIRKNWHWVLLISTLTAITLIDNIAMAQANILIFFLSLLGIERFQSGKPTQAGLWLGFATAIKLIPLIFFVYFFIKRQWRVLWGGVIAFIITFGLVPFLFVGSKTVIYHAQWFQETVQDHATPLTLPFYSTQLNPSHQNLQAVAFRWLIDWEFRERTGGDHGKEFFFRPPWRFDERSASQIVQWLNVAFFLFFCMLLVLDRRTDNDQRSFADVIALTLTAMMLFAPKTRTHFYVFMLFPWWILFQRVVQPKDEPDKQLASSSFLVSCCFYFLQGIQYCKFLGTGAWSVLVLFIYFTHSLFRKGSQLK